MNTRPKIPANARNLNCCIIGSSGSGKTRFWLTPQLLQAHSSYVVVDPKGGVLGQVGGFLQKRGYKIKVFNSIDFSKSMHYNPLAYIRNEADILKFVDALISNTKGEGKEGDPFWTKSETLLYCALIAYIIFEGPAEDRNMNTLVDMISGMEVKEDDEDFMNAVDYMFAGLEKRKPDCFAVKQYKKYKLASGKTAKSILISCGARLAPFDIPQLREVMAYDELELDRIGDRKTAVFFIISDTTQTYNFLVALAFSQMFNLLCERADNVHGGRLPHHVRVLWDEAANTGQVPQLEKLVAVIRSREVSLCCCINSWHSARPFTISTPRQSSATWTAWCSSVAAKPAPSRKYPRTGWEKPQSVCRLTAAPVVSRKATVKIPSGWPGTDDPSRTCNHAGR